MLPNLEVASVWFCFKTKCIVLLTNRMAIGEKSEEGITRWDEEDRGGSGAWSRRSVRVGAHNQTDARTFALASPSLPVVVRL